MRPRSISSISSCAVSSVSGLSTERAESAPSAAVRSAVAWLSATSEIIRPPARMLGGSRDTRAPRSASVPSVAPRGDGRAWRSAAAMHHTAPTMALSRASACSTSARKVSTSSTLNPSTTLGTAGAGAGVGADATGGGGGAFPSLASTLAFFATRARRRRSCSVMSSTTTGFGGGGGGGTALPVGGGIFHEGNALARGSSNDGVAARSSARRFGNCSRTVASMGFVGSRVTRERAYWRSSAAWHRTEKESDLSHPIAMLLMVVATWKTAAASVGLACKEQAVWHARNGR